jgi:hypothetical protein
MGRSQSLTFVIPDLIRDPASSLMLGKGSGTPAQGQGDGLRDMPERGETRHFVIPAKAGIA